MKGSQKKPILFIGLILFVAVTVFGIIADFVFLKSGGQVAIISAGVAFLILAGFAWFDAMKHRAAEKKALKENDPAFMSQFDMPADQQFLRRSGADGFPEEASGRSSDGFGDYGDGFDEYDDDDEFDSFDSELDDEAENDSPMMRLRRRAAELRESKKKAAAEPEFVPQEPAPQEDWYQPQEAPQQPGFTIPAPQYQQPVQQEPIQQEPAQPEYAPEQAFRPVVSYAQSEPVQPEYAPEQPAQPYEQQYEQPYGQQYAPEQQPQSPVRRFQQRSQQSAGVPTSSASMPTSSADMPVQPPVMPQPVVQPVPQPAVDPAYAPAPQPVPEAVPQPVVSVPIAAAVSAEPELYTGQSLESFFDGMSEEDILYRDCVEVWAADAKPSVLRLIKYVEGIEDKKQQALFGRDVEYLNAMIDRIYCFTRLEYVDQLLDLRKYNFSTLVKECLKRFSPFFMEKRLGLLWKGLDVDVITDRRWFVFALTQVIFNSVEFTPEGGKIAISAKRNGDYIDLMIDDSGKGISADELPCAFIAGYMGDEAPGAYIADENTDGAPEEAGRRTGMGLFITQSVLRKMGGDAFIESNYGKGTRVTLRVPANTTA